MDIRLTMRHQFQGGPEFMLGAVKRHEYALKYASLELKAVRVFMLEAVKQTGYPHGGFAAPGLRRTVSSCLKP